MQSYEHLRQITQERIEDLQAEAAHDRLVARVSRANSRRSVWRALGNRVGLLLIAYGERLMSPECSQVRHQTTR